MDGNSDVFIIELCVSSRIIGEILKCYKNKIKPIVTVVLVNRIHLKEANQMNLGRRLAQIKTYDIRRIIVGVTK